MGQSPHSEKATRLARELYDQGREFKKLESRCRNLVHRNKATISELLDLCGDAGIDVERYDSPADVARSLGIPREVRG